MKKLYYLLLIVFFSSACKEIKELHPELKLGEFGAFYTKLNSGEELERYSRTGPYADIIVDLGADKGVVVFWRILL